MFIDNLIETKYLRIKELPNENDILFCEDKKTLESLYSSNHIKSFVGPVVSQFMKIKDKDIRELLLSNYIELFSFHSIGTQNLLSFWKECFQ